jgi:hypothetical protein
MARCLPRILVDSEPLSLKAIEGVFIRDEDILKHPLDTGFSIRSSSEHGLQNNPYLVCEYNNLTKPIADKKTLWEAYFNSGIFTRYSHSDLWLTVQPGRATLYLAPGIFIADALVSRQLINVLIEWALLHRPSWRVYHKSDPSVRISGILAKHTKIDRNMLPFTYVGSDEEDTHIPSSCHIKFRTSDDGRVIISRIQDEPFDESMEE